MHGIYEVKNKVTGNVIWSGFSSDIDKTKKDFSENPALVCRRIERYKYKDNLEMIVIEEGMDLRRNYAMMSFPQSDRIVYDETCLISSTKNKYFKRINKIVSYLFEMFPEDEYNFYISERADKAIIATVNRGEQAIEEYEFAKSTASARTIF